MHDTFEDEEPVATAAVATPARIEAASRLRALGHALVSHHVDDEVLARITAVIDEVLPQVEAGSPRRRPVDDMKRRLFATPPDDGTAMRHFPDCIVSGEANPMGLAMEAYRDGDDAVARVVIGPAFEGAPGRAHGGIVAAIFDDTMGYALTMLQTPAYTGRLAVAYRAPTPLEVPIEFRARLQARSGRKLTLVGEARHEGEVIADAEALFIAIPPERFGLTS